MNAIAWYLLVFVVGFSVGYFVKDQLTVEKKIEVEVKKQVVKGKGNKLNADFDVNVNEVAKPKRRLFNFNRNKKQQ